MSFAAGFLCGFGLAICVLAVVAFFLASKTVDQIQNFDDLEGEGRG